MFIEFLLIYFSVLFISIFTPFIYYSWNTTNKWVILITLFYLLAIFGNFSNDICKIIFLLFLSLVHIFIIIDSTRNSYDFERNKVFILIRIIFTLLTLYLLYLFVK